MYMFTQKQVEDPSEHLYKVKYSFFLQINSDEIRELISLDTPQSLLKQQIFVY